MTPEAQRIAIAEACGWTRIMAAPGFVTDEAFPRGVMPGQTSMSFWRALPDYLSDLNAMHEAEKVLTPLQRRDYWTNLALHTNGVGVFPGEATAAQRAEAFLRTLGKWDDSK